MRTLSLIVMLLLVGCEAQSTPIASISSPTAPPEAQAISTDAPIVSDTGDLLRYGILANTVAYLPHTTQLSEIATVETVISDTPLEAYDVVIGYGLYDGWRQTPQNHTVSLVINPNLAPLTNNTLLQLLPSALDVQALIDALAIQGAQSRTSSLPLTQTEIRTTLANAGYPDGISLVLGAEAIPALDTIQSQFVTNTIDVQFVFLNDNIEIAPFHMALVLWANETERANWVAQVGDANVLDLWSMPLSYLADESLTLEFTENGLPIPAR